MNQTQSKIKKLVEYKAEIAVTRRQIKAFMDKRDALRNEIANLMTDIRPGDKVAYYNPDADIQKKKVYRVTEVRPDLNGEPYFWAYKVGKDQSDEGSIKWLPLHRNNGFTLWKL